jgi:hypothetical protein
MAWKEHGERPGGSNIDFLFLILSRFWRMLEFRYCGLSRGKMKNCLLLVSIALMSGCISSSTPGPQMSTGQGLLGTPSERILACAGRPLTQAVRDNVTIFRYYREAALLEESTTTSKGSQAGMHHGCWAALRIENNAVTGVEFRTVPEGIEQYNDECEAIFADCGGL